MTYIFPAWEDTEIENPTITLDGLAGTKISMNSGVQYAFVDILITTDDFRGCYRLEANEKPQEWSIEGLQTWVANQLINYEKNGN